MLSSLLGLLSDQRRAATRLGGDSQHSLKPVKVTSMSLDREAESSVLRKCAVFTDRFPGSTSLSLGRAWRANHALRKLRDVPPGKRSVKTAHVLRAINEPVCVQIRRAAFVCKDKGSDWDGVEESALCNSPLRHSAEQATLKQTR